MPDHFRFRYFAAPAALAALSVPSLAMAQGDVRDRDLIGIVEGFAAAKQRFDPAAMAAVMADDYVEISPIGDVDRRAEVLGFYDPKGARPAPAMRVLDPVVSRRRDSASVVTKLAFTAPGPRGAMREVAMRVTYAMVRDGDRWKIATVQYTPIRNSPAAAPATPPR